MQNFLSSHLKVLPVKPPTRNQRFLAALERNHSKKKQGGSASTEKKQQKLRERKLEIQQDADRLELLEWIIEIQSLLKLSNKEFAIALGISEKSLQHYRLKVGYLPSKKTFRKLLELEKLTKISIVVKKNRNLLVKRKAMHTIVIN